jgi:hypothetical protein
MIFKAKEVISSLAAHVVSSESQGLIPNLASGLESVLRHLLTDIFADWLRFEGG